MGENSSESLLRVAVVGGGVFGVSTAAHLARRGAKVWLTTEGAFADGASGRSLSWLNSARFRSPHYHRLRMEGLARYRLFAKRHAGVGWLRFDGGLTWDANDQSNAIAQVFAHERAIGYSARLLSSGEVASLAPGVDPGAITPQGAIFNDGEGWVDLPSLIEALVAEFLELGGHVLTGVDSADVEMANGRATGITLKDGERIPADAIVLALGAQTPGALARLGVRVEDSTPISLLLRTKPLRHSLRAVLNTPRVAIRPEPAGGFVLDSAWSEAAVRMRDDGTYAVAEGTLKKLMAEGSAVLEGNPELELADYRIGPKPIPGDGEPVLDELDEVRGVHVVFSHSGATLGLIVGELIADAIVSGKPDPLMAPFHLRRFKA